MTTGTKGNSAYIVVGDTQYCDFHSWNGVDGKYIVVDGVSRPKYNAYTMTRYKLMCTKRPDKFFITGDSNSTEGAFNSNDTLKLTNKLISKVKNHELNAAVFAAEGKKTVRLVKDSILTVGGALVDVKHGNIKRAMQRLGIFKSTFSRASDGRFRVNKKVSLSPEDIASRWLELQYGWKPLLNDVYEASRAYAALTEPLRTYHYKVSTRRNVSFDGSASPLNYTCPIIGKLEQRMLMEMTEKPGSIPRSLGLEDPFTVAWELVPYSFVVDWFLPIGAYLEAAHSAPLLTGRWYKTTARTYTCSGSSVKKPRFYEGSTFVGDWLFVDRTTGTGNLDVPLPTFKTLDQALSPAHIYNAIALVTNRLRGNKIVR